MTTITYILIIIIAILAVYCLSLRNRIGRWEKYADHCEDVIWQYHNEIGGLRNLIDQWSEYAGWLESQLKAFDLLFENYYSLRTESIPAESIIVMPESKSVKSSNGKKAAKEQPVQMELIPEPGDIPTDVYKYIDQCIADDSKSKALDYVNRWIAKSGENDAEYIKRLAAMSQLVKI